MICIALDWNGVVQMGSSVTAVNGDKSCQFLLFLSLSLSHQRSPSFVLLSRETSHPTSFLFFHFHSHCKCFLLSWFLNCSLQLFSKHPGKLLSVSTSHKQSMSRPRKRIIVSGSFKVIFQSSHAWPDQITGLTHLPPDREGQRSCPQTAAKFTLTAPILPKRPKKGSNLFCRT